MNRYTVTIQGWGEDEDGVSGEELTQIDLTVRKISYCNEKYQTISYQKVSLFLPELLINSMFCADSNLLSAGTCYGDSGGPAMIRDESGLAYTLVGVVSGNPVGCTKTKVFPDYFTYVGHDEVCSRNQ